MWEMNYFSKITYLIFQACMLAIAVARLAFIPLFIFCNLAPDNR